MPKTTWHVCHHCDGVGCEVCEYDRGWFETAAERDARVEAQRGQTSRDLVPSRGARASSEIGTDALLGPAASLIPRAANSQEPSS